MENTHGLERLEKEKCENCKKRLKWINVNDKLPESCDIYLVCNYRRTYLAFFDKDERWYTDELDISITHWMKLPQPMTIGELNENN